MFNAFFIDSIFCEILIFWEMSVFYMFVYDMYIYPIACGQPATTPGMLGLVIVEWLIDGLVDRLAA